MFFRFKILRIGGVYHFDYTTRLLGNLGATVVERFFSF